MESNALFQVIDVDSTYNKLLGRPWMHQNGVVSSKLHQCFKYCRNGQVKTVIIDTKPFTMAKAHYDDTIFYLKDALVKDSPSIHGKKDGEQEQSMRKGKKVVFKEKDEIIQRLKDFTLPLTRLNESRVFKPQLDGFLVQQDVAKLVQEPSESTNMFVPKSIKISKVRLKKIDSVKTTKPKLGFSSLKLKIHKEASEYITIKEINEKEENKINPLRAFMFN